MKNRLFEALLITVSVTGLTASAWAQPECNNSFDGSVHDDWHVLGNWSLNHVPDDTEVACIPPRSW